MKLTQVLFRFKPRLPRGSIWRGKYRVVPPLKPLHIARRREDIEIEEENMFYLRNPYMTPEQSYGHTLPFQHKLKFIQKMNDFRKWKDNKLLGDRFGYLKITDKWE